jgi:hypothetical protein
MGITFGDFLIDSGHYDPKEQPMPIEDTLKVYNQIANVTADPGDGTVRPGIEDVLARGFHAMGWANPTLAAYELLYGLASQIVDSR